MKLKDERIRGLADTRLDSVPFSNRLSASAMPGTWNLWGKGLANYASITVPDTASISTNEAIRSSFYCAAAIREHKQKTSRRQNVWLLNGVNEMAEKLTTYDPARIEL